MSHVTRILASLGVVVLSVAAAAFVFFGLFVYGMGMGAFSSSDFARFSGIAEVAMWASLLGVPALSVGSLVATVRGWPGWAYGLGALLAVLPVGLFFVATTVLY
ncbi:MAG: hypothetical protein EP330_00100 [Deltaproteobacteria bacterium]|nr:MAG: hypothetical protein EP330_00100 [Deltaproteobacteria bacterium]